MFPIDSFDGCHVTGDALPFYRDRLVQTSRLAVAVRGSNGATGRTGTRAEADGHSRRSGSKRRTGRHGSAWVSTSCLERPDEGVLRRYCFSELEGDLPLRRRIGHRCRLRGLSLRRCLRPCRCTIPPSRRHRPATVSRASWLVGHAGGRGARRHAAGALGTGQRERPGFGRHGDSPVEGVRLDAGDLARHADGTRSLAGTRPGRSDQGEATCRDARLNFPRNRCRPSVPSIMFAIFRSCQPGRHAPLPTRSSRWNRFPARGAGTSESDSHPTRCRFVPVRVTERPSPLMRRTGFGGKRCFDFRRATGGSCCPEHWDSVRAGGPRHEVT